MKKHLYLILVAFSLVAFSCASTTQEAAPEPAPEPTSKEMATLPTTDVDTNLNKKQATTEKTDMVSTKAASKSGQVRNGNYYSVYSNSLDLSGARTYTIKSGDWFHRLSNSFYGNRYCFPLIMAATNYNFPDPDLIMPGTKLTIPDLNKNRNNPDVVSLFNDVADVYDAKGTSAARQTAQRLRNAGKTF